MSSRAYMGEPEDYNDRRRAEAACPTIPPGISHYDNLGNAIGKPPKSMGLEEFKAAGCRITTPLKAIRANCLDCMGGSAQYVRECGSRACPLWPFRSGKNPFHGARDV